VSEVSASGLGAAWAGLVRAVEDLPRLLDGAPDQERASGWRYLLGFLAAGLRVCIEADETGAPALTRSIEPRMTWGLDNPDTAYRYTRLDGAGRYRVTGDRGSARHLELQVNTGHQGDGDYTGWRALWVVTGDDLDDEVDVELPPLPDASFLLVREYFSDWQAERPATLAVERLDRPLPPPPLGADELGARLALLTQWLTTGAGCWDGLSRGLLGGEVGDVHPFLPPGSASGQKGQAYGMGPWRCEEGEALVVEVAPPPCRYWGLSLCDRWWQSIDPGQRQSSLNDSQAVTGDDGRVTCVVAHDDPGVANWLDPGGRAAGTLAVRYLLPAGGALPPVSVRRVDREGLPQGLPSVTPAERQSSLRYRQRAMARRLRW